MDELHEKSLKLLADPCKLKDIRKKNNSQDRLKYELEYKFHYPLTNKLYQHLVKIIKQELIIDSCVQDLINQVSLNHNP